MKTLNKKIQFVKSLEGANIPINLIYRVKTFGETESVLIIDKKATIIKNSYLYQDMECYKSSQKLEVIKFKK